MREISSHFVLPKQSILNRWAEALPVLLSSTAQIPHGDSGPLNRVSIGVNTHLSGKAFLGSCFFHFFALLFLTYAPSNLLFSDPQGPAENASPSETQIVYYDLRTVHLEKTLPNLASHRAAGKTGHHRRPRQGVEHIASRGSDAFHPRLTMAMNPPRVDSVRQTIVEPAAPPDLKITEDVKLPNIMIESPSPSLRPHISMRLNKPLAPKRRDPDVHTPGIAQQLPQETELFHSALPAPSAPALPVPTMSMPAPKKTTGAYGKPGAQAALQGAAPPASLLAMSAEPGALQALLAVPLGNRYGSFSVSPAADHPGSPGGNSAQNAHDGSRGTSPAGSAGGGSGAEATGEGGENSGDGSSVLTVSGGAAGSSGIASVDTGNHMLLGTVAAAQVFPVLAPVRVRGLNIQVFTGPDGGGGLAVYGVLPCNKIYTVALPMPSRNWVLQYCTRNSDDPPPSGTAANQVLRLDRGLVAPDPSAKFDFKRPDLPTEDKNKLIVLRGAIAEDGSVANVNVLKGVDPKADTLAAAAFRRWKFQPALQSGKPVRVEVLVGVPVSVPGRSQ